MPELYLPSPRTRDDLAKLVQGFIMDIEDDGTPILLFKFDAGVLTSLINGCRLELIVGHPAIFKSGVVIMIYDNEKNPLFLVNSNVGPIDETLVDFPKVIAKIVEQKIVKIGLFNEVLMPVFSTNLDVSFHSNDWHAWLAGTFAETALNPGGHHRMTNYPEQTDNGFLIKINNEDHSGKTMMNILFYDQLGETAKAGKHYNFSNYLTDGKHGYNQEQSLTNTLSPFFELDKYLFVSPLKIDGTEFTDFVILLENAYMLIESKFVVSQKPTKIVAQIQKAVKQLKASDEMILCGELNLQNKQLQEELLRRTVNLRICIYNDSINLTIERCQSVVSKYRKVDLPFFISVTGLKEMLANIYLMSEDMFRFNIEYNLKRFFIEHQKSDRKVIIITNAGTREI